MLLSPYRLVLFAWPLKACHSQYRLAQCHGVTANTGWFSQPLGVPTFDRVENLAMSSSSIAGKVGEVAGLHRHIQHTAMQNILSMKHMDKSNGRTPATQTHHDECLLFTL